MKLSTRAQYGVRLMYELGLNYGKGPVYLKDIAQREEMPLKYLSQLILPLKAAGFVNSLRGSRGGYMLAKHPSEIVLKDVIEVLEGSLTLVECLRDPSFCKRVPICASRKLWRKLEEKISETLESFTLDDLLREQGENGNQVLMYNI